MNAALRPFAEFFRRRAARKRAKSARAEAELLLAANRRDSLDRLQEAVHRHLDAMPY